MKDNRNQGNASIYQKCPHASVSFYQGKVNQPDEKKHHQVSASGIFRINFNNLTHHLGTKLISKHQTTGFLLVLAILALGGKAVYSGAADAKTAENIYQIPQAVVSIADELENREDAVVYAAFPPEMLIFIRQYDVAIRMPYGREMLDENWGGSSGFYQLMSSPELDFEKLAEKCDYNFTRYLIVDGNKSFLNQPQENGFEQIFMYEKYIVYEYTRIDWEQRQLELEAN